MSLKLSKPLENILNTGQHYLEAHPIPTSSQNDIKSEKNLPLEVGRLSDLLRLTMTYGIVII